MVFTQHYSLIGVVINSNEAENRSTYLIEGILAVSHDHPRARWRNILIFDNVLYNESVPLYKSLGLIQIQWSAQSFTYAAHTLRNNLDTDIRILHFKLRVKTMIYFKYFAVLLNAHVNRCTIFLVNRYM